MKVLFLSLLDFNSFSDRNIYTDLLRELIKNGNEVYCISPIEKRMKEETHLEENGRLLRLKIGNIQKTNVIEKGISTLLVEKQFISAIKKYFSCVKFDLILYSTPPITFSGVIKYVKKRDNARTYLMLKDIFPQNAVDLGMMRNRGVKGYIYKYFRAKEKKLYALSDRIGCMSEANVDYLLEHNPTLLRDNVEVCPNCIDVADVRLTVQERMQMRERYGLPQNKMIFVYGGNLGRPQDVPFIISCLKGCAKLDDVYFVIAGSGTDRYLFERYIEDEKPTHVRLFEYLPKNEYDRMIACCDVGLIFLDHRFTIPNFPSRLLSYMQAGLPVLACTDASTDIGKVITDGNFGWWCESDDETRFSNIVSRIDVACVKEYGNRAFDYLESNYSSKHAYEIIMKEER